MIQLIAVMAVLLGLIIYVYIKITQSEKAQEEIEKRWAENEDNDLYA